MHILGKLRFFITARKIMILRKLYGNINWNSIMVSRAVHYYRGKHAVIKTSGWFSTCASPRIKKGTRKLHTGRISVQGWESVCWGVLGTPCLKMSGFRDLWRFHHRKIHFVGKNFGEADCVGPKKIQTDSNYSIAFNKMFDFIGFAYVLRVSDFPIFYF